MLNFGHFDNARWFYYEIPLFCLMGLIGGLLGAAWVATNKRITILRSKILRSKIPKAIEASLIGLGFFIGNFLWQFHRQIVTKCVGFMLCRFYVKNL